MLIKFTFEDTNTQTAPPLFYSDMPISSPEATWTYAYNLRTFEFKYFGITWIMTICFLEGGVPSHNTLNDSSFVTSFGLYHHSSPHYESDTTNVCVV